MFSHIFSPHLLHQLVIYTDHDSINLTRKCTIHPKIEAAIRTCKVNTGWANRVESDRFLNPNLMMCPVWNGMDTAGRSACPDSFYTKRGGCNSAIDRLVVENDVSRPQYLEYITLSPEGIKGGNMYSNTMPYQNTNMVLL